MQELVEKGFNRALMPKYRSSTSRNIAVTCFADRVGSALLRGTIVRPPLTVCSVVIGQWIISCHHIFRFRRFFWLRQWLKSDHQA